jgi:thiamine biosynthesis lipoprotein ApbE
MKSQTRRRLAIALFLLCGSFSWIVVASHRPAFSGNISPTEFYFHHDHVIGTSLDLWVTASEESAADAAEQTILGEIERLRRIFSTYDPQSEISRVNRTQDPVAVSPEMIEVLRQYESWQDRSHGAFNGQLGKLVSVWQTAEKTQQEPDAATLRRIVYQICQPGWRIDEANLTVTRLTDQPLNLNSIAKGYIIGKAGALARERVPSMTGLLLNLGGDMYSWGQNQQGRPGWDIGVQDPHHPEDNAPVLARVRLRDSAIATSGGYERFYTVQGKRHSHIFDPRSGQSATGSASATVIAKDNVTANALATTLCVLTPEEGLRLIGSLPGVECFLVAADGRQLRSPGFAAFELPLIRREVSVAAQDKGDKKDDKKPEQKDDKKPEQKDDKKPEQKDEKKAWPDAFEASISVTLPNIAAVKYRRPYVAIWVANADAKPVRTVAVWGNNARYFKDLPEWWKFARNDNNLVQAVTRATRAPGKYSLVWDGKDDKGNALPQGTYTIFVEVHREHGKLVRQTGKLVCGPEPTQLTLDANAETGATIVEYRKKK